MAKCKDCCRPKAEKKDNDRHSDEYKRNCPTQTGKGKCWCEAICWGGLDCDEFCDTHVVLSEAETLLKDGLKVVDDGEMVIDPLLDMPFSDWLQKVRAYLQAKEKS